MGLGMGPVKGTEKNLTMETDEGIKDQVGDVWATKVGATRLTLFWRTFDINITFYSLVLL